MHSQTRQFRLLLHCLAFVSAVNSDAHYSWQRAQPLIVSAQGGTLITVTGNFNATAGYACQFVSTDLDSVGAKFSAVARPSDGKLHCIAPVWTYGAQETTLRIFSAFGATGAAASDVRDMVPGPGATADRINYAAVWQSRSLSKGGAEGGISIDINGYGFDRNDADYVCKFVCIHSSCDTLPSQRFAQSAVPAKPLNDKLLKCISPLWPFTAFSDAGTTRLVLEKGGVELAYVGTADGQNFQFEDKVTGADKDQGLATAESTLVSIAGFGFDVQAQDYSCEFSYTDLIPYVYAASPAVVLSSREMQCHSPHWVTEARTTKIQIFKHNCRGSRSSSAETTCDPDLQVERAGGIVRFQFIAAVQNLSVASTPAGFDTSPFSVSVNGGGFSPLSPDYSVAFVPEGSSEVADSLMELNVTASSVTGQCAQSVRQGRATI